MHVIVRAAMGMGHTIVEVYPAMGVSDALSVIPVSQQFYGIGILSCLKISPTLPLSTIFP